jgi:hypothetical protein
MLDFSEMRRSLVKGSARIMLASQELSQSRSKWFRVLCLVSACSVGFHLQAQNPTAPPAQSCPGGAPAITGFMLQSVTLSAAILSATQHQQTYKGLFRAVDNWNTDSCGWPHQRTRIDLPISYDEKRNGKATPNITRNAGITVQHLFFVKSNAVYSYIEGDLYHNNSLGVYLRQSYGGGFGFTHGPLELNADLRFTGEHFYSPGVSASLVGAGLKGMYNVVLVKAKPGATTPPPTLSFTEQFVPVFNQSRSWYSNGGAFLSVPFNARWALTVTAQDNYLRNAPYTFRRNYFNTSIGITYTPK